MTPLLILQTGTTRAMRIEAQDLSELRTAPAHPRRLLIVDTESTVLQFLTTLIAPYGFVVVTATRIARAVAECGRGEFDLILLDIELWCDLRQFEQAAPGVPIVFLSANTTQEIRAEEAGGSGVILPKFQPTGVTVPRLRALCDTARQREIPQEP